MKIKNLKYMFLFFVFFFFLGLGFGFEPTCDISDNYSTDGCSTWSAGDDWYCSVGDGGLYPIGVSLYLSGHKDKEELYLYKEQWQANKFLRLMFMWNKAHEDNPEKIIVGGAGLADPTHVGNMHYLMDQYGITSHSSSCRLGNKTLDAFFTAQLCPIIYSGNSSVDVVDSETGGCADDYFNDGLFNCCIKHNDCNTGFVKISDHGTGIDVICERCPDGFIPNDNHSKCVCNSDEVCCGIQLYVGIPFIGDCIEMNSSSSRPDTTTVTNTSAFPVLMQGLMKVLMSVILVVSFLLVIVSGLMMTAGAFKSTSFDKGKTLIKNVIISLILLGLSGLILKLINPSFFGG